ncbi:MAG TPA: hypothetical protein VGG53_21830 [Mycobacterium sp.]|uniref:hypothetical protein n=1 Tax=Mycobacterium sp. TaxID=1785 RepID=UPI002F3FC0AE
MAWFLALQGPSHTPHQSMVYELQDGVEVEKIAQELVSSATLDRVVAVPAVLSANKRRHQKVTIYVRPAAWGLWSFYELSDEDRREMAKNNPVVNALAQAAQQRAAAQGKQVPGGPMTVQVNPLTGQVGPVNSG